MLLTDTRESRWLPTLLCAVHDKMILNVALGLDSFLIMRHGGCDAPTSGASSGCQGQGQLGCYFCNDVVAPDDSTRDRTLDQQCTVSRPGLAPTASALAVELMVALQHHPLKHRAPADPQAPPMASVRESSKPLGVLPHQIRGFMSTFGVVQPMCSAFAHCTACSPAVCAEFEQRGFDFVERACNDFGHLELVSGLTDFKAKTDMIDMEDWEGGSDREEDEAAFEQTATDAAEG